MSKNKRALHFQRGASLLEVLISVLVLSIGLIGALKMQSEAVRQNANARYVSQAGIQAMQIMETIKSTGTVPGTCSPRDLPNGGCKIDQLGNTATITITWTPPGTKNKDGKTYAEEVVYALDTRN